MLISIKNVSKTIKNNSILQDISVDFESGNIYGIKGKNGSGKTMLLKAISGLTRIDKGKILINEKELGKDMDFPESIGILIEDSGFPGGLRAFDNLKVIAAIKGRISSDEIKDAIKRVGLSNDEDKKYRQYSLGMKQKLNIAAAIMERPDIILLDEPTNGLDDESVVRLKMILKEEKDRGALVIVVSHDLAELENISDEMYQMREGKVEKI